MTSFTKPEVHNISHRRQRSIEPRPLVTFTETFMELGHAFFQICEWTDRQTNKQTDRQTHTHRRDGRILRILIGSEIKTRQMQQARMIKK